MVNGFGAQMKDLDNLSRKLTGPNGGINIIIIIIITIIIIIKGSAEARYPVSCKYCCCLFLLRVGMGHGMRTQVRLSPVGSVHALDDAG